MLIGHIDREWIEQQVRLIGFDLAGVAAVPLEGTAANVESSNRFAAWVASGRAGEMEWHKRLDAAGELIRGDLRRSMPWARSVVVCAINYNANAPLSIDEAPSGSGWIASLRHGAVALLKTHPTALATPHMVVTTTTYFLTKLQEPSRQTPLPRLISGADFQQRAATWTPVRSLRREYAQRRQHRLDRQEYVRPQSRASAARGSCSESSSPRWS